MNTSQNPKTDEQRKPLTSREHIEHLYDLMLAILTRSNAKPDTEVITYDTYSTGPQQGRWHAKLVVPRGEGEDLDDWNARHRRLFVETDALVMRRNDQELRIKMEESVALLSDKRGGGAA